LDEETRNNGQSSRRSDHYDTDDLSRLDVLERTIFGFADKNTNVWIPGMLQVLANGEARQKRIEKLVVLFGVIIVASINVPVLREIGMAILRVWKT
jgi:hypothetical protein